LDLTFELENILKDKNYIKSVYVSGLKLNIKQLLEHCANFGGDLCNLGEKLGLAKQGRTYLDPLPDTDEERNKKKV